MTLSTKPKDDNLDVLVLVRELLGADNAGDDVDVEIEDLLPRKSRKLPSLTSIARLPVRTAFP